jgi:hypothetical protein
MTITTAATRYLILKSVIHGAHFDMTAADIVTQCVVEMLRRAGRQVSSLPRLPYRSEREAVLWLELNNVKELLVRDVAAPT